MLKLIIDTLDEVEAEFHKLYVEKDGKFHLQVEGLEHSPFVKKLKDEAAKNRIKVRELEDALEPFTALGKPEDVQAQLDRIPELEAAAGGKLDDTQINTIVETRLKAKTAPLERQITQLQGDLQNANGTIETYKTKERTNTISEAIRAAAKRHDGFRDSAVDDAIVLGERVFEVDESGSVVTKDGVGVTPGVDPHVWLTEMQPKRQHWWGETVGAGSTGSRPGSVSGPNPWTHDGWNMTEQGKILRENPKRAEQLARSAGVPVTGGQRPKPKQ